MLRKIGNHARREQFYRSSAEISKVKGARGREPGVAYVEKRGEALTKLIK